MNIPGLRFIPQFLSALEASSLTKSATHLHQAVTLAAQQVTRVNQSVMHNLDLSRHYKLLKVDQLQTQHFDGYGEEGHKLSYFIDNANIPSFVKSDLLKRVETIPEIHQLKRPDTFFNWRMTLNIYERSKNSPDKISGFPFHKDISSNGDVTMICTLLASATFQIKNQEQEHAIELTPGSLLVLSGEARWNWTHRVLPAVISTTQDDKVHRISIVLGCRALPKDGF